MARRRLTIGRAGNYSAPIDTAGMDPAMVHTLSQTKPKRMNKVEREFLAGAKNPSTAAEAIRRARRANK